MTVLREITNQKHREVEALPLIQAIMQGKITKEQYVSYLFELHAIYKVLENLAEKNGLLDGLDGIQRTQKLQEDLDELQPGYTRKLTASTLEYLHYLIEMSAHDDKKHLLFAHIYVRHMGDLYGGKLMARVVPGAGRAYQFDDRPGIIKVFNERLSMRLGDEANVAFDHFIKIFKELWNDQ